MKLPKLPKAASVLGAIGTVASYIVGNQAQIVALTVHAPKSVVQAVTAVIGLAGVVCTLLGHSLGTETPAQSEEASHASEA